MPEEQRSCGVQGNNNCNCGCGGLGNLCGGNTEILFFLIIFLLLFTNF